MFNTSMDLSAELTRIILPVNIFVGVIGNSLNILVLTRPSLYKNTSARYFLALATNNLFGSTFTLIVALLAVGYQIDIALFSLTSCKIVQYFNQLCEVLSSYFIVLASMDRYFSSSLNANRRKWSNTKTALWIITFITGFFAILYLNTAILSDIQKDDRLGCYIRPTTVYHQIYPIMQMLIFSIIAPCLMALFGILAICNTKHIHVHPVHITYHRRTERQLGFMLLIQVSIFILLNLPICIVSIMISFSPMSFITPIFLFITNIFEFLQQFSYTTPFFLYIISGHIFRTELIRIFNRIVRCLVDNHIIPATNHMDTHISNGTVPAIAMKEIHRC